MEKRYPDNPNDNEWGVSTGYRWRSHGNILITPDKGLNGKLDVHSDLPRNNTIRYIEVRVTNEDGNERTVTIEQYPLEYITNIQGWYSYRDDFKNSDPNPTTYEYVGDKITGIALATRNISSWNGEYRYLTGTDGLFGGPPDGFFVSKVAKLRNDGSGQSDLYEYYYTSNSNRLRESRYSEINGRMYTIVLTGTSSEYTLGRPRMVQDTYHPELMVTDPGQDNAQLVSPSFMIGSCVGEFQVGGGNLKLDGSDNSVRVAREHCAHYVETYKDPKTDRTVTLDDWRLPTEAELKIIFKFQGSKDQDADAIDYRLNGQYYYSASEDFIMRNTPLAVPEWPVYAMPTVKGINVETCQKETKYDKGNNRQACRPACSIGPARFVQRKRVVAESADRGTRRLHHAEFQDGNSCDAGSRHPCGRP